MTADLLQLLFLIVVGAATFLFVQSLYPRAIFDEFRKRSQADEIDTDGADGAKPSRLRIFGGVMVQSLGDRVLPLAKPKWRDKMGKKFVAMGRPEYRAEDFIAQQFLYGIFFTVFGLLILNFMKQTLWYTIPFTVFGLFFPYIWLRDQLAKRQKAITRALPYQIDLLTLSVEAGQDFQAALSTVVEKGQSGPLNQEFAFLLREIRFGTTRAQALRNFADRVQLPQVSAFVANLVQADRMGTSMGKVLRIQSTQMRVARTHRAEKLANEAPVKMLLPLIGCIFPTVFAVLFGPIIYRWISGGG
jgi:tight adherence protein C